MKEQLIKKNCSTGEYSDIFPITTLDSVLSESGDSLIDILRVYNHLYVPCVNRNTRDTKLQVPVSLRRKGLWLTYVTPKEKVVTEYYNSYDLSDKAWTNEGNWVNYIDTDFIQREIRRCLSWYRVK